MVARSYLLSLLAVVATLGNVAFAAPQDDNTAPPLSELASVPLDVATPSADSRPVPGAEAGTLTAAAPELESGANEGGGVTKRDASPLEKRAQCGRPGAHHSVWSFFAPKFCELWFPNARIAYYLREGRCVSGSIHAKQPHIRYRLNFRCCARQCGAHVNFVGVTQQLCKAYFRKAVTYGQRQCPRDLIRQSDNARDHKDPLVCSFWAS